MPFRRFTLTLLVGFFVAVGFVAPADAATPNWLDRLCNQSSRTTSCVEEPLDYDSLESAGSLTFHDSKGHRHVATTGKALWSIAAKHSVKCERQGDMHGCFTVEPGIGRAVVLHDGMEITLKFIDKH